MGSQWVILLALMTTSWALPFSPQEDDVGNNNNFTMQLIGTLARQLMSQQDYVEETQRADSGSGIRQIRVGGAGVKSYHTNSHTGNQQMAMHNHANHIRTVGLGEFNAVLNGVEFRTRHNDYKLLMPSTKSSNYKAAENIPFPEVPPQVLQKETIAEQVTEMQKFFEAFHKKNTKMRDYRPYFKPVLCYLEGAWTSATDELEESFESDRHFLDAKSWFDLSEKQRFTSYTGSKQDGENLAWLPTKIVDILNDSIPVLAQWNYRILCAPVYYENDKGLSTSRFRVVDDLMTRKSFSRDMDEQDLSRSARYSLHTWTSGNINSEPKFNRNLLDILMEQIPGYDNYQADIRDDAFDSVAMTFDGSAELNSGFYHRRYRSQTTGAMGNKVRRRSFADHNLFMAQTTQTRIPGATYNDCKTVNKVEVCKGIHQRWSWAIPLEVVYMTPLLSWNPYNLIQKGKSGGKEGQTVTAGGRNGGFEANKAYNGTRDNLHFQTPAEFFGDESDENPADTNGGTVGVIDPEGNVRKVKASGTRIFVDIEGIGAIRTRYPINPIANEGNQILKELEALKDIVMRQQTYIDMLIEKPVGTIPGEPLPQPDKPVEFAMGESLPNDPPGLHSHTFEVMQSELDDIIATGNPLEVYTSEDNGHSHRLVLKYTAGKENPWSYSSCDGGDYCWDGHPSSVTTREKSKISKFQKTAKKGKTFK